MEPISIVILLSPFFVSFLSLPRWIECEILWFYVGAIHSVFFSRTKWNCVEWIICINCVWLLTGNTRWMTKMLWEWHKNARHRVRTVQDRIDIEMKKKMNRATARKEKYKKTQDDSHKIQNPLHTPKWKRTKKGVQQPVQRRYCVCFISCFASVWHCALENVLLQP